MAITGGVTSSTPVHSGLREKFDYASAVHDHRRAAQAGGPRQIARDYGRPRGSDRFPRSKSKRRTKSERRS